MTVYIPTMDRYDNLQTIVPYWLNLDMPVRLVVEPSEFSQHSWFRDKMGWRGKVRVIPVRRANMGIGYARRECVAHAESDGLASIIMSDDDMRPAKDADMWKLLQAADTPEVLGIGAVRSIHDRFTGGAISRLSGPVLCPGGWGFQLFALNVQEAMAAGNFDPRLHTYCEDAELARQGIKRGIPWQVHCDIKCAAIGKRYDPGGIGARFRDPAGRTAAERECLTIIHDRWPKYTSPPDKRLRVAWQKMLDDFIPDWRERSAIHGGGV